MRRLAMGPKSPGRGVCVCVGEGILPDVPGTGDKQCTLAQAAPPRAATFSAGGGRARAQQSGHSPEHEGETQTSREKQQPRRRPGTALPGSAKCGRGSSRAPRPGPVTPGRARPACGARLQALAG